MCFMVKAIRTNPAFWLYVCLLFLGALILITGDKGDTVLFINQYHTPLLDQVFTYWTYLGDGWIFALVLIISLFVKYYNTLLLTATIVIQTSVVQIFKHILLPDIVRPRLFFVDDVLLNYVAGVDVHGYHAFPSGHTATAFAIVAFLVVTVKNTTVTMLAFFLAFGVALSRMYLLQHFLVDVYFGSIIGVISVLAFHIPCYRNQLHEKSPWNLSLLRSRD